MHNYARWKIPPPLCKVRATVMSVVEVSDCDKSEGQDQM